MRQQNIYILITYRQDIRKIEESFETDGNGVVFFFLSGSHLMFCFSGRKSAVILNAPFALRWDIWRIFISPYISKSCQAEEDYRGFTLETLCKLYAECR